MAEGVAEKQQYIYVLKLIPRLNGAPAEAWTDADNKIVETHFHRLQKLLSEGKLILAGRTLNEDDTAFGIVILEVDSEDEARSLMDTDPAVSGAVMTAELYPYRAALLRGRSSPSS